MNCFVIMPFSRDFDDVYASIKLGVDGALASESGRCFRLDEARPAGRITDRLQTELQTASLCVADLTGNTPNVMWEVGYVMALLKPIIIVTQSLKDLPFDLKDMQSIEYSRSHLSETLAKPLRRMVIDTLSSSQASASRSPATNAYEDVISELRNQVSELKSIVSQAVGFWSPKEPQTAPPEDKTRELRGLEGSWINTDSGSHMYAALVDNDLVMPYCYGGDERLVAVYFGWKRIGDLWFARFAWVNSNIAGFAFLKQDSVDVLTGAWWMDEEGMQAPLAPPEAAGVQMTLQRRHDTSIPQWATRFLDEVRREGLASRLARR